MLATLFRTALLAAVAVATHLAVAVPAQADNHGCVGYSHGPTGEVICNVSGGQNTTGSSGIRTSGGSPGCFYNGQEIPCQQNAWQWNNARQCYVMHADQFNWPARDTYEIRGEETDSAELYACQTSSLEPPGGEVYLFWSESPPPPPVMVNPADLAAAAVGSMGLRAIAPQIAPPPLAANSDSMGLVGLPVWMWSEPTPTTWGPLTATASALGVTVSATAEVESVDWAMGDGTVKNCGPGTPYDASYGVETQSPDCGHVYERSSRDLPDRVYTVTATSYWAGDWSGGGQSGTVALDLTGSDQLPVGEAQAIRTN